jgi:8-oxo-dGTP diphosphatase
VTNPGPRSVDAIDWPKWQPSERAVLCFVFDRQQVLLIHKKTGLGAGKINAPGGRIDPGESAAAAAVREVAEETGVAAADLSEVGQLFFEFTDGYKLHGTVFFSRSHSGTLAETVEADPFWCDVEKMPYERMWADDRYWLPLALAGGYVKGYFVFEGDVMLSKRVETEGVHGAVHSD